MPCRGGALITRQFLQRVGVEVIDVGVCNAEAELVEGARELTPAATLISLKSPLVARPGMS